jgi:V8-like Glu-specific endopeptidase
MRKTKIQTIRRLAFGCAALAVLSLAACSVNVKKEQNGEDKQVDIQTPVGGIHVSKDANVADVGLAVYPGARLKQKDSDGEDKSANVNISGLGFGLKVVALEYESNDSPAKLIAYYKDQLQKYGHVLECHTSHLDLNTDAKGWEHSSHELTCEGSSGSNVELKVGTKENQHIVAIKPEGEGSSFSLVYVRTHGKDAEI